MQSKLRKQSRLYGDRAKQIKFPSRHFAAQSVLSFLGDKSNDGGASWYSYEAIMDACSIRQRTTMSRAIKFIIDYSTKEIGRPILTYKRGTGGERQRKANSYKLHLGAMEELVRRQGVYDLGTGKRINASETNPDTHPVQCDEADSTESQSSAMNHTRLPQSSAMIAPVQCDYPHSNPHEPPVESKANQQHVEDGGVFVSESGSKPAAAQPPAEEINDGTLGAIVPRPTLPALPCNFIRQRATMTSFGKAPSAINQVTMATAILEALAAHGDGTPEARIKTVVWQAGLELKPVDGGYPENEETLFRNVLKWLEENDDIRVREQRVYRLPCRPLELEKRKPTEPAKPIVAVQPPSREQAALAAQWENLLCCQKLAKRWTAEHRRHCPSCDEGIPVPESLSAMEEAVFCCPVCGTETNSPDMWVHFLTVDYAAATEEARGKQ